MIFDIVIITLLVANLCLATLLLTNLGRFINEVYGFVGQSLDLVELEHSAVITRMNQIARDNSWRYRHAMDVAYETARAVVTNEEFLKSIQTEEA